MFRKIVSNLSFSPALVGQLGFYAKRLRKEETTRRIGLIFTAFALVFQFFSVFQAPESASAASANDFVYGGVHSQSDVLINYDRNTNDIKDLYTKLGITRQDVINATRNLQYRRSTAGTYSWGLKPMFGASKGEGSYTIKTSHTSTSTRTYYYRPQRLWGSYTYSVYVGRASKTGMWFGIMRECGNLITQVIPPAPKCASDEIGKYPSCTKRCTISGKTNLAASDKNCKATPKCTIPGKTNLLATDKNCKADATAVCSALTITKDGNTYQYTGDGDTANGATISKYTFVVKRDGKVVKTISGTKPSVLDKETAYGTYTVTLTISTSVGDKTSTNCAKSYQIVEPKKCDLNPSILATDANCQPCPGDSTVWINDSKCSAEIIQTKTAQNITQNNADATTVTAKGGDQIVYKVSVKNKGLQSTKYTFKEDLADVLQYASITNNGGGTITTDTSGSADTKTLLVWPETTIKAGETQTRVFTVKLQDTISAKAQGSSDPNAYDCKITNTFGNSVTIAVACPVQKQVVEQTVAELPHTGPTENMIFAGVLFAIVTYFYARSRQLKKEVRLIRRDFNAGTI